MLPFLCGALSACSLINSYDDVKLTGGGGGSGAGDPTGGSGGQPPIGGGPAGGEGTGGAGGTPQIVVNCEVSGTPFQVEDLSTGPMGQRSYDGNAYGYQPNGDQVRVFLRVQQEMRGIEIDVDAQTINDSFTLQAQELMWARPVGPNTFGLLVASPQVGVGYPLDLLVWPNNQNLQDPDIYAISAGPLTGVGTNSPRGLFVHAGNEPDNIALLLRTFEGGMHRVRYARHEPGTLVETSATIGTPATDEEAISPRALVRTGTTIGTMHAFVGSPTMDGVGGTKQWVFPETATTITGTPSDIGPPGAILVDAQRKQDETINVAAGQISATDLKLKGDNVTEANLGTIDTANFNTLIELNSFLDVPNTGESQITSDAVLLIGANSTKDKIVMIVAGLSGGAAINNTELLLPSADADGFSDVAVFVTNSPISALGGIGRLIYSERHDTGPNAYDALMVATIACEQRQ